MIKKYTTYICLARRLLSNPVQFGRPSLANFEDTSNAEFLLATILPTLTTEPLDLIISSSLRLMDICPLKRPSVLDKRYQSSKQFTDSR